MGGGAPGASRAGGARAEGTRGPQGFFLKQQEGRGGEGMRASRLLAISQGHSSRHGVGLLVVAVPRACSSAGKKSTLLF